MPYFGVDDAKYKTPELEIQYAMEMLKLHMQQHQGQGHVAPAPVGNDQQQVRPEKIRRHSSW